uniref:Exocyst complex component 3-like 2 n=1 Tax=Peromyscus maniculatus bairdii TaxID=230844 RepID=A0A8C8UBJ7_PERMB
MQDEPYQVLVAELHRRALVEYVRPLLRGRLRCRSARTRSRVAGRLREDAAQCSGCFGGWSPRRPGWTRWYRIWPRSCSWRTLRASRWRSGCLCGTTQTSGASMWQPSWTSEDCGTQLPVRRFWRWPGTWNSLKVVPYHPLGTAPSLRTSPCPAHPSASASLSSWGASRSPGWPGPAWLVCPCGHGLRRQFEPEPSAEAAGAHAAADPPSSLPRDPWPETRASGTGGALASPPSPECPPKGNR